MINWVREVPTPGEPIKVLERYASDGSPALWVDSDGNLRDYNMRVPLRGSMKKARAEWLATRAECRERFREWGKKPYAELLNFTESEEATRK